MAIASSGVTITGLEELERNLGRIVNNVTELVENALHREAEVNIAGPAKEVYVPVLTGALRSSIRVMDRPRIGRYVTVAIEAGGPAVPYAAIQHENMSFSHVKGAPGGGGTQIGGPKYLERPLLAAIPGMAGRLARAINIEAAL